MLWIMSELLIELPYILLFIKYKLRFGGGHIAYCFGHQIVWTSCTFKHVKHGFYLLERFNNMYILGMRVRISVCFA